VNFGNSLDEYNAVQNASVCLLFKNALYYTELTLLPVVL